MLTIVIGEIRVGKSAYMTARGIEKAKDREKTKKRYLSILDLKHNGYKFSENKYALYSDYSINFKNYKDDIKSVIIDPKKLFSGDLFLQPHSTMCIQEGQIYFNSRAWQSFGPDQSRFFQTSGHFGIDIFIDTQDVDNIDKTIRQISKIILIKKRIVYDEYGHIVEKARTHFVSKITWQTIEYETYNKYLAGKGKKRDYSINYNIYDCYNPFERFKDYLPKDKTAVIL